MYYIAYKRNSYQVGGHGIIYAAILPLAIDSLTRKQYIVEFKPSPLIIIKLKN